MDSALRYLVLDFAFEESSVWELTRGMSVHHRDGSTEQAHAPTTVARVRPVLEAAVRAGHVELHLGAGSHAPGLSVDKALAAIASAVAWSPPVDPDWIAYEMRLTDAGDAEHQAISDARASGQSTDGARAD